MVWNSLKTLDEFKEWVEAQCRKAFNFSFKVGVFNDDRAKFNGLGHFFNSFFGEVPVSRKKAPIDTPLGILTHRNLILEPAVLFEPSQTIPRQGDIFKDWPETFGVGVLSPSHWVVLSHSCDIQNKPFILVAPAFCYSSLSQFAPQLGLTPGNLGNATENKMIRFVSLPPNDVWEDSVLILDLALAKSIPNKLTEVKSVLSLSLCGIYYLQNRLGIFFLRDVKETDDARTLRGDPNHNSELSTH